MREIPAIYVTEGRHYFDGEINVSATLNTENVDLPTFGAFMARAALLELNRLDILPRAVCEECHQAGGISFLHPTDDTLTEEFDHVASLWSSPGGLGIYWTCARCGQAMNEDAHNAGKVTDIAHVYAYTGE